MTTPYSCTQAQDSSSYELTARSLRSEKILELGKKLVVELGLADSVDTLGRWMAHYIAVLIHDAETADSEEKAAKLQSCSEAILSLWKHRHVLASGRRPFEGLEPILRALESLDPTNNTPRYFGGLRPADPEDQNAETRIWLNLADGFDYSAKVLIRYCLVMAAEHALNKSQVWVELAGEAGLDDGIDIPVIRIVGGERALLTEPDPTEEARKELEDRIERLEAFQTMSADLLTHIKKLLIEMGAPKQTP